MSTHNFRVGTWKKKRQTPQDHFKFLMNSTNVQRSFVHELCAQKLGHPPSNMWGVPIPQELHPQADPETVNYVMHASKHAPHEFGRLISSHKKASGFISTLGDLIGDMGKAASSYGGKVAKFIGKHGKSIQRGVSIGKDLIQTGSTIAQLTGLIHPETKSTIDSISAAVHKHVTGDHYGKKPDKKGGRILI